MFKTYLEIISQEAYKKLEERNKKYITSEKYKQRSEELLKRFFTNEDGKIVNTIIVPYISPNEYSPTSIDKEIVDYLNEHGYKCTKESYLLGYCFNDKNKEMSIVDVLKMIKQYNLEKLEKQKQENLQYSANYDKRIKAKQNFKENYLTYYQNFNKKRSKVIVFTWLPRAIASMSTDVGWTSCMDLYGGGYDDKVFPTIEAGAFIAWLVQRGDEEILDNPQARILIKVYVSESGKVFWYPSTRIYGTASKDFHAKVKDFVLKKQEIYITNDDLEDIYIFDQKQYLDNYEYDELTLKNIFKEKYVKVLENKIKNTTTFTTSILYDAIQFNIDINLIKKILENIKHELNNKDYEEILEETLDLAYTYNHYKIINLFLLDPQYSTLINKNTLFLFAVKMNNINVVKDLLQKYDNINLSINNNNALLTAIKNRSIEIVKLLLQNKNLVIREESGFLLSAAIKNNDIDMVKLLLQYKQIDPTAINNIALQIAIENGHIKIVKLLLQDPRVNSINSLNPFMRFAIQNGHIEIVKLLLQDKRVDPSYHNNNAIKIAAEKGYIEIIKLLLQDKRVESSINKNILLSKVVENGHIEIVKLLLQDKKVDPSDFNNYAIRIAAEKGYTEIIKLLLQDKRVDPGDFNNYAIRIAAEKGYTEIVKLLLQDKRVDPSDFDNYAIKHAIYNSYINIVKLLLKDKRVRSIINNVDELLDLATHKMYPKFKQLLQQYK